MTPAQLVFMDKLDSELSKVESFFIKRVAESRARSLRLKEQLGELKDHRRLFHVTEFASFRFCAADLFEKQDAYPGAHHNTPLPFLPVHRLNSVRSKNNEPPWSRDTTHTHERARAGNQKEDTVHEIRLHRQASAAKLLQPEDYISARKKLKRAVAEHYNGLEVLNNYRVR